MRLPIASPLRARPGNLTKDARMINCYAEVQGEEKRARKRAGTEATALTYTTPIQGFSSMTDTQGLSNYLFAIANDDYTFVEVT